MCDVKQCGFFFFAFWRYGYDHSIFRCQFRTIIIAMKAKSNFPRILVLRFFPLMSIVERLRFLRILAVDCFFF